jgi:BirA family transcriptional regulator, biotin operon repressor / biotin---[acetyl-CoA-carboxylase] ligase
MGDPAASPGVRWRIRRFDEIDSTNRVALDAARDGEPPGLVVVADHQTAGRGRRGRVWTAPPASSLLLSVLLEPPTGVERLHLLTMAAGVALCDAVRAHGIDAGLKWPNDVVVGDRKLAGILAETESVAGTPRAVVVGVGCNVTWASFPDELADTATACDVEAGQAVDRVALLDAFLDALGRRLGALDGAPAAYRGLLSTLGRRVRVELADATIEGVAVDVDTHGRLVIEGTDGTRAVAAAGDVVHLRPVRGPGSPPPGR